MPSVVAVVTEQLETFRVVTVLQPLVKLSSAPSPLAPAEVPAVDVPVASDVVNAEEEGLGLATAGTPAAVSRQGLFPQAGCVGAGPLVGGFQASRAENAGASRGLLPAATAHPVGPQPLVHSPSVFAVIRALFFEGLERHTILIIPRLRKSKRGT